jgi:hypothetical protein
VYSSKEGARAARGSKMNSDRSLTLGCFNGPFLPVIHLYAQSYCDSDILEILECRVLPLVTHGPGFVGPCFKGVRSELGGSW